MSKCSTGWSKIIFKADAIVVIDSWTVGPAAKQ